MWLDFILREKWRSKKWRNEDWKWRGRTKQTSRSSVLATIIKKRKEWDNSNEWMKCSCCFIKRLYRSARSYLHASAARSWFTAGASQRTALITRASGGFATSISWFNWAAFLHLSLSEESRLSPWLVYTRTPSCRPSWTPPRACSEAPPPESTAGTGQSRSAGVNAGAARARTDHMTPVTVLRTEL